MKKGDKSEPFSSLVGEVTPLKAKNRVRVAIAESQSPGLKYRRLTAAQDGDLEVDGLSSRDHILPVNPFDILSFKRDGVQHGVFKKLRQGRYPLEATIDLHRLSFNQAREALADFVKDCQRLELRSVLVTHGKGAERNPPALLKSAVNHWLRQLDVVLAFHSAQPQHGGSGATYVMFRKGSEKKAANRERYGLRGYHGE